MQADPTNLPQKPMRDLSYSSNKELKTCARKYQIRKLFTQPKHSWETGLAAVGGTAMHEYIQNMLVTNDREQARLAFFYAYDFVAEEEATEFTRNTRAFEACLHAVEDAWFNKMNLDPSELAWFNINGERRPAIEVQFQIVFRNPAWACDYRHRGAIDTVLYNSFYKRYKAIDYKTHRDFKELSSENQDFKFKYDDQLVPYGLVIEQLTQGDLGPKLEFDTEYHSIFIDIQNPDHRPYPFRRSMSDVHQWYERIVELIMRMESYNSREVWPRTGNGCESWGKPCTFFNKCHIEDPDELQKHLLGFGKWEPATPHTFNPWVTLYMDVD